MCACCSSFIKVSVFAAEVSRILLSKGREKLIPTTEAIWTTCLWRGASPSRRAAMIEWIVGGRPVLGTIFTASVAPCDVSDRDSAKDRAISSIKSGVPPAR